MKTYVVNGKRVAASSAEDLVSKMRRASFTATATDQEFMAEVAARMMLQSSAEIRTDSAEAFVADLIRAGVIKVES